MLGFMDCVQQQFHTASNWDRDNSYGALTATARALLEFPTPTGLCLSLSSLASPNFATSYSLRSIGAVDGSLSYLYSSPPLKLGSKSKDIPLRRVIQGYRQLREPQAFSKQIIDGALADQKDALLYGRLYLPTSLLEALYLRRVSPSTLLKISCVSSSQLKSGGSILFLLSRDVGKHSTEYLYSTDSALFGIRGLYNFGPDPRQEVINDPTPSELDPTPQSELQSLQSDSTPSPNVRLATTPLPPRKGLFSAGLEVYYGLLNRTGGMSSGIRFATLPAYTGFPYTMTLTLNPLMGNLSSTYSVKAGSTLALSSRFDFNVYSYESGFQIGCELWRKRQSVPLNRDPKLEWVQKRLKEQEKLGWEIPPGITGAGPYELDKDTPDLHAISHAKASLHKHLSSVPGTFADDPGMTDEQTAGVLKARMDQDGAIGLFWEGRIKELLYSFGATIDLKQKEQIFRGVGLEFQYST